MSKAKNPHAVALGQIGGKARLRTMTAAERQKRAAHAGTFAPGWPKGKPRGPRKEKPEAP